MKPNDVGLTLYNVYRQLMPTPLTKDNCKAALICVGEVWAVDGERAIEEAKRLRLAVAPMVEVVR